MDNERKPDRRRRCSECGRKYQAEASAKRHQKTCSKKCRLKRRAAQARVRYQVDLSASREAARERKRRSRTGLKGQKEAAPAPAPAASSKLPAEVTQTIEKELDSLSSKGWLERGRVKDALYRVARRACASTMSRAGLEPNLPVDPQG